MKQTIRRPPGLMCMVEVPRYLYPLRTDFPAQPQWFSLSRWGDQSGTQIGDHSPCSDSNMSEWETGRTAGIIYLLPTTFFQILLSCEWHEFQKGEAELGSSAPWSELIRMVFWCLPTIFSSLFGSWRHVLRTFPSSHISMFSRRSGGQLPQASSDRTSRGNWGFPPYEN